MIDDNLCAKINYRLNCANCKYLEKLLPILKCETDEEAINQINKIGISEKQYYNCVRFFEKNYGNAVQEIEWLRSLYPKYKDKYNIRKVNSKTKTQDNSIILNDLVSSKLSIEEYASKTGENIHFLCTIITHRLNKDKILEELSQRDKTNFYKMFDNLALDFQNDEFDIIDYFLTTKLQFDDFMRIARERIKNQKMYIAIEKKISKFKSISKVAINRQIALNEKFIIKGIEITKDMKEEAFDFIEENNLPYYVYKTYIRNMINRKVMIK